MVRETAVTSFSSFAAVLGYPVSWRACGAGGLAKPARLLWQGGWRPDRFSSCRRAAALGLIEVWLTWVAGSVMLFSRHDLVGGGPCAARASDRARVWSPRVCGTVVTTMDVAVER